MRPGQITAIAIGIAVASGATVSLAQYGSDSARRENQSAPPEGANGAAGRPAGAGPAGDMGAILIQGLRETPGCLGVESGGMTSGKQVIFAFFKDKEAALAWYHSPTHQRFRQMMPPADPDHVPMKHVPEGVPVMALASISFTGEPAIKDSPIPFSQIAIELFAPLTGGLSIGGGFSPDEFRKLVREPE